MITKYTLLFEGYAYLMAICKANKHGHNKIRSILYRCIKKNEVFRCLFHDHMIDCSTRSKKCLNTHKKC